MAKRKPPLSILIACEGSNTEPIYLERLIETMDNDNSYPYAFTIYPDKDLDKNPKTDAIGLVNVVIERMEDYDESWVVFDKDGYTKHSEAFELARQHNIKIAFSSISIETWILSHFERNKTAFNKSADIIHEKFHTNESYLTNYAKKGGYNVYPYIKDRVNHAYENVAYLRWLHESQNKNFNPYEVNPFTDIDKLIKKISLTDQENKYVPLNKSIRIKDIEIIASANNEIGYLLKILNLSKRSHSIHEFSILDAQGAKITLDPKIIDINETYIIKIPTLTVPEKIFILYDNIRLEINHEAI